MPIIEQLAQEYGDRVAFVAVAWKGTLEATRERAAELMPSGVIRWGLDTEEHVFSLYRAPYQPHTALITAGKQILSSWAGVMSEEDLRAQIEGLLAAS